MTELCTLFSFLSLLPHPPHSPKRSSCPGRALRRVSSAVAWLGVATLIACSGSSTAVTRIDDAATADDADSPSAADVDAAPMDAPRACDFSRLSDIAVSSEGLYGNPPYAIDGCLLAYVAADRSVHSRDLATGTDTAIAPATELARAIGVSAGDVVWERAADPLHLRIGVFHSGIVSTIDGPSGASEPRVLHGTVVFTRWRSAIDSDVYAFDLASSTLTPIAIGPAQQRFADVSDDTIALTDFAEDPDGQFNNDGHDLADIALFDRKTLTLTPRKIPGKQAFPTLDGAGAFAYMDWNAVHPEPKFSAYKLRSATVAGDPALDRLIAQIDTLAIQFVRPAARAGVVTWVGERASAAVLERAPLDGSAAVSDVPGLEGLTLFAPVPAATVLVIGVRASADPTTGPAGLRALATP